MRRLSESVRVPKSRAMRGGVLLLALALVLLVPLVARAQGPGLPAGARTRWTMSGTRELVAWATFDPVTVAERRPAALRFVTIGELATGGVGWARDYLATHAARGGWGVSFLEIVRADSFAIDGRAPRWRRDGAAALWCARVAPVDSTAELGAGQPFLVLDFWVPDRAFTAVMRELGHYATHGDATLARGPRGSWRGTVRAPGLDVVATCTPAGEVSGGAGSAGVQALFAPATFTGGPVVRVSFAGHRVQDCDRTSAWRIRGTHPLARADVLAPSSFEFGYTLQGGAYAR